MRLADAGVVGSPIALTAQPDGVTGWVLSVSDVGDPILSNLDMRDGLVEESYPLNGFHPGTGYFTSLAADYKRVFIGWHEQMAVLQIETDEVRIFKLPEVKQPLGSPVMMADPLGGPAQFCVTDMILDDSGTLWIARENANSLLSYSAGTGVFTEHPLPRQFGTADKLALGRNGWLWMTCGLAGEPNESVPGGRVAHDRVGAFNVHSGSFREFPVAASQVVVTASGDLLFTHGAGIDQARIQSDGLPSLPERFAAMGLSDVDRALPTPDGGAYVTTSDGVAKMDARGRVTSQAWLQKQRQQPATPAGVPPEGAVPVQPRIEDMVLSADGDVWMVVKNYESLAVVTP
jgi:hypothetical protein